MKAWVVIAVLAAGVSAIGIARVWAEEPAPTATENEQAFVVKLQTKAQAVPPQGATPAETRELQRKHLEELKLLCQEYLGTYPQGQHVAAVRVMLSQATILQANVMRDKAAGEAAAQEAEKIVVEIGEGLPALELRVMLIQHYLGANQPDRALTHAKALAEGANVQFSRQALVFISKLEKARGHYSEAIAALRAILEKHPDSDESQFARQSLALLEQVGKTPELKFTDTTGKQIDLADYSGKVVLVDFWASWCAPCREEMPNVVKVYADRGKDGLEILGISLDEDRVKMEAYMTEAGMTWPQSFEGNPAENRIAGQFGIIGIPMTILIDRKGIVRAVDLRGDQLLKELDLLLKEVTQEK